MVREEKRIRPRGQTTIEYLLMVAFGAIFSLQVAKFFNDVFREGLTGLEGNISRESQSGNGFTQ
jgi:type II secretory pathway component PulJ